MKRYMRVNKDIILKSMYHGGNELLDKGDFVCMTHNYYSKNTFRSVLIHGKTYQIGLEHLEYLSAREETIVRILYEV